MILLGFATLMFGMETMTGAVAGLKDVPAFRQLFICLHEPGAGRAGRCGADGDHPVQLRLRGHPAGAGRHGAGQLWRRHSHHHGPEHRHLRHGAAVLRGHQQERQARRRGASDRSTSSARRCWLSGVLHRRGAVRAGAFWPRAGHHVRHRRGPLRASTCCARRMLLPLLRPAGEAGSADRAGRRKGDGADDGAGRAPAGHAAAGAGAAAASCDAMEMARPRRWRRLDSGTECRSTPTRRRWRSDPRRTRSAPTTMRTCSAPIW